MHYCGNEEKEIVLTTNLGNHSASMKNLVPSQEMWALGSELHFTVRLRRKLIKFLIVGVYFNI